MALVSCAILKLRQAISAILFKMAAIADPSDARPHGPAATGSPEEQNLDLDLVNAMHAIFGKHPGYRTTHAKGLLVQGTFTPTPEAKTLCKAAHYNNPSTPLVARFSVGGGIPNIPDSSDTATPKGVAIRFQIDDKTWTDLISHSFDGFATRTGEDFLTFLSLTLALRSGTPDSKEAMARFLETRPEAKVFFSAPKPNPHNFGTITYYEPNTHILTNAEGKTTNVRFRLYPADGDHLYEPDELKGLSDTYLHDDLLTRFPARPLVLNLVAHIADPDDVLDDATTPYKSTTFVPVGKVEINKVMKDNVAQQQKWAFSPAPELGGVQGIQSSSDPLIQTRKGVYFISTDQRIHEKQTEVTGIKMP